MEQKNARQDEEDERQSITRGESNRLTEEVGEQVGRRLHGQANGRRRGRGEERRGEEDGRPSPGRNLQRG